MAGQRTSTSKVAPSLPETVISARPSLSVVAMIDAPARISALWIGAFASSRTRMSTGDGGTGGGAQPATATAAKTIAGPTVLMEQAFRVDRSRPWPLDRARQATPCKVLDVGTSSG